jgi:hypothetical protein
VWQGSRQEVTIGVSHRKNGTNSFPRTRPSTALPPPQGQRDFYLALDWAVISTAERTTSFVASMSSTLREAVMYTAPECVYVIHRLWITTSQAVPRRFLRRKTISTASRFLFGTKFLIARYTPDAWRMRARPKKV